MLAVVEVEQEMLDQWVLQVLEVQVEQETVEKEIMDPLEMPIQVVVEVVLEEIQEMEIK
tara:strand:- start:6 stop:182 length:177 start_codon:yes stop_codon:yes gene_type:complete